MKRIIIIGKYYYPFRGGIEENCRHIAEHLSRDHAVTVLAFNHGKGSASETLNNVNVIRRKVDFVLKSQPVSFSFFSGVNVKTYDLVHFHSPNPFAAFMFLLKKPFSRKVPLVVTHHMDIHGRKLLRAISLPFVHWLIRNAEVTIVTSRKNIAISRDLPKSANYAVVPLGIAPEDYVISPEFRQAALEWRRSLVGDAPAIGFVGRHARYKGLPILMEALALTPRAHALVAGDGPYRAVAQQKAQELGIADRVHFLGSIDHQTKLKLLSSIDVFAFPSTEVTEAFGISQMEAMLCGAPVVASDLPTGVTDVSIDGETALLAPPFDHGKLASQISRLLDDRAFAAALAARARDHILKNMTHEVVSRRTREIFESAIARTRGQEARRSA